MRKAVLGRHASAAGSPDNVVVFSSCVCEGSGGGARSSEAGEELRDSDVEKLGEGEAEQARLRLALPLTLRPPVSALLDGVVTDVL